jgi:cell filamentation protein
VPEDPYADPVTGVLRNKLGLSTTGELETAEREITHAALIFLKESPVKPSYDLGHLCMIHRRIFGDIYDWARQLRTVAIAEGSWFCLPQYIESSAAEVFRALHGESLLRGLPRDAFTDWQHLDANRNIAASAAIMRGEPALMRKMLGELVREP